MKKREKSQSQPSEEWKEEFLERVREKTLKGKYKEALGITKSALKLYPDEFVCRYQYARILGDWADELPKERRKKLKREAIKIIKPLLRQLNQKPMALRFSICLNYYYQSELFKKMYAFGKRFQTQDKRQGLYAQGLGAALLAHQLLDSKRSAAARAWAMKSKAAWESYGLKKEKYYFAHYAYAKALAIAGEKPAALRSLQKAARVSQREVSDWEFADVLALIER